MGSISTTIKLIDGMSDTLQKIKGNVDNLTKSLEGVTGKQSSIDSFSWSTFLSNAESAGKRMAEIGRDMSMAISAPLLMLGKKTYNAYKEHESAMTGVKKTVEATDEQFQQLEEDLVQISQTSPTGFVEAAKVMEMAGQMGVPTDKLTAFTNAYIALMASSDVQGETGAQMLARFMNVTGESFDDADKLGGVIVELGNNFATTESEILAMATRMGATGDLAGFTATEILTLSAALSSVGINAEAGGSAAGKLMKKMQLAAEVGGSVEEKLMAAGYREGFWTGGVDFSNWLSIQKKQDVADLAWELGVTTDAVQEMADAWVQLDQFTSLMGMTKEEFIQGWDENAAQSMLKFFTSLNELNGQEGTSILAQLADMNLTEIRLSNLIAAMAGHPEYFQNALGMALAQYGKDPTENAMAEEYGKRLATTESQDQMLMNQLENTFAEFGENVKTYIEPAKESIKGLLDNLRGLSEVDQDKIVKVLGALVIGGPALFMLGKTVSLVSSLAGFLTKISGLGGIGGALKGAGAAAAGHARAAAGTAAGGGLFSRIITGLLGSGTLGVGGMLAGSGILAKILSDADVARLNAWHKNDEAVNRVVGDIQAGTSGLNAGQQNAVLANFDLMTRLANAQMGGDDAVAAIKAQLASLTQSDVDQMFAAMPDLNLWQALSQRGLGNSAEGIQTLIDNDWLNAMDWYEISNDIVSSASEYIANASNTVGTEFDNGFATAINSGASNVINAAVDVIRKAIEAAKREAGINSPSKETYWIGKMMDQGMINAVNDGRKPLVRAVANTVNATKGAWSNISYFADLEKKSLTDSNVKISDSDVQRMRKLAEREAINQFTTAQIKVDLKAENNINSNLDVDDVVAYLEAKLTERLEAVAEGVYA